MAIGIAAIGRGSAAATPTTYYIDAQGNDAAAGLSPETAWQHIVKAANVATNDTVLLQRGDTWQIASNSEDMQIIDTGVTVDAYGTGALPVIENTGTVSTCVQVQADDVTVKHVRIQGCVYAGISTDSARTTIREVYVTGNQAGIHLKDESTDAIVEFNRAVNNTLDPNCMGINVHGRGHKVRFNYMSNNVCGTSLDYHGSAVEIYNATDVEIHGNYSKEDNAFTELGIPVGGSSDNIHYWNNVAVSARDDANYLITRGLNAPYGPVTHLFSENDLSLMTDDTSKGWTCGGDCGDVNPDDNLKLRNLVLKAETRCGWVDLSTGSQVDEDWGLYDVICDNYDFSPGANTVKGADLASYDYDSDTVQGKTFYDWEEQWVTTDRRIRCAATSTPNDEGLPDAWPPDFDDDQRVTVLDMVQLMRPYFNTSWSDPDFSQRRDLAPDGIINILDIILLASMFNSGCSP